jgi:hypothetical protein
VILEKKHVGGQPDIHDPSLCILFMRFLQRTLKNEVAKSAERILIVKPKEL